MAIAFSQMATNTSNGGSNTTHSYTGNGLASVSAVTGGIAYALFDSTGTSVDPTSVTWTGSLGAQSMTKLGTINQTTRGNTQSLWYVLNFGSGAVTLSDTFAAANAPNVLWWTYSNVKQSAPEAFNTGSTTVANNLSVSVTTIKANAWVMSAFTNNTGTGVAGANTSARFSGVLSVGDTNGPVVTPSSQAQNWSLTGSTNWTGFTVSMAPPDAFSLSLTQASFVLSMIDAILLKGTAYMLSLVSSTYTLTGNAVSLVSSLFIRVTNLAKHTSTITNRTKNAVSSVTNRVKNISTITNRPKS